MNHDAPIRALSTIKSRLHNLEYMKVKTPFLDDATRKDRRASRQTSRKMLQSLITRMAGYGASFKSYCITVTTAVIGFSFTLHRPAVAALALLPVIAFGVADAQYLRVERRFRVVFNLVRGEGWDVMPSFEINLESVPKPSFLSAVTSWSIVWFYAPLAIGVLLAMLGAWAYG